jgi:hypothetical protein
MYCSKCGRQLHYKDAENQGWCFDCWKIVDVASCNVSYWNLMAVFTMFWPLQVI